MTTAAVDQAAAFRRLIAFENVARTAGFSEQELRLTIGEIRATQAAEFDRLLEEAATRGQDPEQWHIASSTAIGNYAASLGRQLFYRKVFETSRAADLAWNTKLVRKSVNAAKPFLDLCNSRPSRHDAQVEFDKIGIPLTADVFKSIEKSYGAILDSNQAPFREIGNKITEAKRMSVFTRREAIHFFRAVRNHIRAESPSQLGEFAATYASSLAIQARIDRLDALRELRAGSLRTRDAGQFESEGAIEFALTDALSDTAFWKARTKLFNWSEEVITILGEMQPPAEITQPSFAQLRFLARRANRELESRLRFHPDISRPSLDNPIADVALLASHDYWLQTHSILRVLSVAGDPNVAEVSSSISTNLATGILLLQHAKPTRGELVRTAFGFELGAIYDSTFNIIAERGRQTVLPLLVEMQALAPHEMRIRDRVVLSQLAPLAKRASETYGLTAPQIDRVSVDKWANSMKFIGPALGALGIIDHAEAVMRQRLTESLVEAGFRNPITDHELDRHYMVLSAQSSQLEAVDAAKILDLTAIPQQRGPNPFISGL